MPLRVANFEVHRRSTSLHLSPPRARRDAAPARPPAHVQAVAVHGGGAVAAPLLGRRAPVLERRRHLAAAAGDVGGRQGDDAARRDAEAAVRRVPRDRVQRGGRGGDAGVHDVGADPRQQPGHHQGDERRRQPEPDRRHPDRRERLAVGRPREREPRDVDGRAAQGRDAREAEGALERLRRRRHVQHFAVDGRRRLLRVDARRGGARRHHHGDVARVRRAARREAADLRHQPDLLRRADVARPDADGPGDGGVRVVRPPRGEDGGPQDPERHRVGQERQPDRRPVGGAPGRAAHLRPRLQVVEPRDDGRAHRRCALAGAQFGAQFGAHFSDAHSPLRQAPSSAARTRTSWRRRTGATS